MAERGRRASCPGHQPGLRRAGAQVPRRPWTVERGRHATRPANLLDIMPPMPTCSEHP